MTRPATNSTRRKGTVRCAIYTRKSSEEGLEQEFNSLQAQREACEAFITSQRHEGWACLPKDYDDGGFSGARMDRPALQRLLADIAAGRVNIVVVYKIDRLTRSARSPILPRSSRSSMRGAHPLFRSRSSSTRRPRWNA
jgi:site-specific DNA recombinase